LQVSAKLIRLNNHQSKKFFVQFSRASLCRHQMVVTGSQIYAFIGGGSGVPSGTPNE
jgi:hypothetical protein